MYDIALYLSSRGGGVQRGNVVLANALVERGINVLLIMPQLEGPFLRDLDANVRQISLDTRSPVGVIMRLAATLRRHRPVVLIASDSFGVNTSVVARALARSDARVIGLQHTVISAMCRQGRLLKRRLIPWIVRALYPCADRIVAVSQAAATDLAKMTGVRASEILVIPSTTITPQITELAKAPTDIPWLDSDRIPVILAVGDLRPEKDYETLIRAFAFLRAKVTARLIIIGEGKERPKLEALARDLGVIDDVHIAGHVANSYAHMARANVLALSSLHEGFGNVLIEAMACGCPVVSTDCGGPREILDHGRYGRLIPVGDHLQMAIAIADLLRGPLDRFPKRLLQHRAAEFGIDRIVNRYRDLLGIQTAEIVLNRVGDPIS